MAIQSSLLSLPLLLSILLLFTLVNTSLAGRIATYWGQGNLASEGKLLDACNANVYNYVNIAFLSKFGGGGQPELNLGGHCDPAAGTCKGISTSIRACQRNGIKVLLSIGGGFEPGIPQPYTLNTPDEAHRLADYLWNNFLGGSSRSRPLGDAVLDGIDFDIEGDSTQYYDVLAKALRGHGPMLLTAAPQCIFPDKNLGQAISANVFDKVWVQFYNNPPCQYDTNTHNAAKIKESWNQWLSIPAAKVYMGLPAGLAAAGGGYIPKESLKSDILPFIQRSSPRYGGVMLWNRAFDIKSGYSNAIKANV